jgi:hypothetical protein
VGKAVHSLAGCNEERSPGTPGSVRARGRGEGYAAQAAQYPSTSTR